MEEVTMMNYLVEPGEYVFEDDDIIQVESQKGAIKIKSTLSGMVSSYLVEPDQEFNVGDEYCEIDVDAPVPEKKPKASPAKAEPVAEVKAESAPVKQEQKKAEKKPEPVSSVPMMGRGTKMGVSFGELYI